MAIEDIIRSLSILGFDGIEVSAWSGYQTDISRLGKEDCKRIRKLARDFGLIINALGCHTAILEPKDWVRRDRIERTKKCIDAALQMDCPIVDTLSGPKPKDLSDGESWQILAQALGEVLDYAEKNGITIGFEPHVGNFVYELRTVLELLKLVPSKNLAITFDQSHFAIQGLDLGSILRKLKDFIAHVHVKDVRGIFPNYEFLIPGEGSFPFEDFFSDLHGFGYEGFITAEVSVMRSSKPGYDPYGAARLTYITLSNSLRKLGLRGKG
ncbi:sugar phosphate isomerase/epimerase [Candidatus Bathyarchaeota archaeon]|nr:sugar phosphate isomerase/epimerase [Candidatus Bathyarchaeota archaeon]